MGIASLNPPYGLLNRQGGIRSHHEAHEGHEERKGRWNGDPLSILIFSFFAIFVTFVVKGAVSYFAALW